MTRLCKCGCGEPTNQQRNGGYATWIAGHNGRTDAVARFWSKVKKTEGCWNWIARVDADGYGIFSLHAKSRRAHRVSYEMARGPIPGGLTIDHLCRNRACVNPDHLEAVTSGENVLRGDTQAARNAAKTHCLRGPPFNEHNTYITRSGGRSYRTCRTCRLAAVKAYQARRALAA